MTRLPSMFWTLSGLCILLASARGAPVTWTVTEAGRDEPLPCRIHLLDEAGRAVRAPGLPFWKDHFVCEGRVTLDLAPGRYRYEVDRGPEYRLARGEFVVRAGQPVERTHQLHRLADLAAEGWWSGDFHVHRAPEEAALHLKAEDLHVAEVITWWNDVNLWRRRPLPDPPLQGVDANRFAHLMAGEDERAGGALLFFNLDRPLEIAGAGREHPSPMTFLKQARQRGNQRLWVDVEKPFWWDAPVWFASGLVDSVGLANNHMQRAGMLANEAWGHPRDKDRLPDPLGNGFWTQEIYYHLLNTGLRLPPSAGSASGVLNNPVGYNRAYVRVEGTLSYEGWFDALRKGRVFVSNGPLLRVRADGQWPGQIFHGGEGESLELGLAVKLDSRDPIDRVEVVRDGQVVQRVNGADWASGKRLDSLVFHRSGWFLVRVLADVPETFRFASTGPFHVEVGDSPRRISRRSANFFLEWVRQRRESVALPPGLEFREVRVFLEEALAFWEQKVEQANAE